MPEKELVIKNNDLDDDIKDYDLNDLEETNNSAEKVLSNEDFNDLKYKIIDMNKENFIELIDNIKSIQDETQKQELYDLFIKTIKNGIIESDTYENDKELIDEIDNFVVALIDFDRITERLFIINEFNFENIKNQKKSQLEIKKIENSINELENKYLYTREYILKNLLIEKEELENNIKIQKNNTNPDDIATDILLTSLEQVNNDLEIQNKFGNNLTIDEKDILVEDKEYQEQQLEIAKKVIDYEYEQAEIDLAISKENLRILNKQLNVLKNGRNNHEFQSEDLNDKDLKPISEFLDIIVKKNKELPNDKFFIDKDDISYYISERDSSIKLDEKIQELEKLKKQEESKQKELKKNLEDKVIAKKELAKLTNNKIYKETYYNILNNVKRSFKKFDSNASVTNFINNHESLKKLSNYKYFNKLKEELIDESVNQVNLKRIKKVEENKKLWLKALAGVTGFATGLAVSCVPGVGTIRMGLAVAKVTTSAINFYTKKHPNGKISKFKINLTDKLEIKHPKLTENINNMKKKLNSYPLNSFVNGLSLGYLTGNVIEMVSGDNLFNHLEKYLSSDYEDVLANNPINIPTPETKPHIELNVPKEEIVVPKPVTPTPEIPDVIVPDQIIEQFIPKHGEVYNLSSLLVGYESADATSSVNLMESLAENLVFDKAKVLPDGRVRWFFKQLTGEDYAWFDAEVVQELMTETKNILSKKIK